MIDADGLFEVFFRKYLAKNAGKFTEEELENKVGEIYSEFGKTKLKELGDKTPDEYFRGFSTEELAEELKERVKKGSSVSDFLCEEISRRKDAALCLEKFVSAAETEELAVYAVNLLPSPENDGATAGKYVSVLTDEGAGESLAETLTEKLCESPCDAVKEAVLAAWDKAGISGRKYLAEILSCMPRDARVTKILADEFSAHAGDRSLYADYLARYGDESVLPLLIEAAKDPSVSYNDFKEIRFAIESLGGECPVNYKKSR